MRPDLRATSSSRQARSRRSEPSGPSEPSPPPALPLPRGFLRPCVLLLLREKPGHGYELLARLRPLGFREPDAGSLYHLLRKLEREGLVRSRWDRKGTRADRRTYELTRPGMEELHLRVTALATGREKLAAFRARYEAPVAPRR